MSDQTPINPTILRWARETAGLSIEDVVAKLDRKKISVALVQAWEGGTEVPTYSQLERLAYEVYRRPLALFFFPSPPSEETPEQSFRTLPEFEISQIPPRLRYLIRYARVMQSNLDELYDGVTLGELADYLDMKVKNAPRMEELILERGTLE